MRKINTKITPQFIAVTAVIAALYVALTLACPLSYMGVQFRISEVLVLLCFYNRRFIPAMIIGCAVANLFSPFAQMDLIFGTLATTVAVVPLKSIKNIYLASVVPAVVNGLIVGFELWAVFGLPYVLSASEVAFGELVVIAGLGATLFKVAERNSRVMSLIRGFGKAERTR
ncbi:membrane protein [Clostridia bacterium]|nr:membrane protein [Clostridia bacterium]